jgi:predicted DNA-binding transcriptional regulator YafY
MNRIDRITAILIQLQSRRVVKAQDIAERFGISLRTVYRDIKTLEEAGVPLLGEAGIGYSIMDGYRLPPVMFTEEEATAFITAEKFIEKNTDKSTTENYKSAMYKIRAVLRSNEKEMLENMEDHIHVLQHYSPFHAGSVNNSIESILKSISKKEIVHIHYKSLGSSEMTKREIEPIGIFYAGGYWHTIAFCHLRNDYRDFRVDRISMIRTTGEKFRKKHPSLKDYLEQMYKDQDLQTIVIQLKKSLVKYVENQKYNYGFVLETDKDEYVEMTFLSAYPEGFARWYLMFADHARIIKPDHLKERVKALISLLADS